MGTDTSLMGLAQLLQTISHTDVDDVRDVLTNYKHHENPIEVFRENQRRYQEELASQEENKTKVQLEEQLREMEDIGSRITYRCVKCAGCEVCKKSDKTREQSIQDVLQEELIEKSFDIDEEKGVTYARFPWKKDPVKYLKQLWGRDDNLHSALKVFNQQRRKSPEIRAATVKFHQELVGKGFVVPLRSLPKSVQEDIWKAPLRHYLLWRTVFKPSSTSTPCRIEVDPSMSGLNDCLCKGVNCLNSLYMIGINWRSNPVGFTSG